MKRLIAGAVVGIIALGIWAMTWTNTSTYTFPEKQPELSHQQTVWMYALEWCESRGIQDAVNPKDRDGTPSYYSWQFKPSTFVFYGEKYGVIDTRGFEEIIPEMLKNYDLQKSVLTAMILDREHVPWASEFPACVKRLGFPPK